MKLLFSLLLILAFAACSKDKDANDLHKLLQKHAWAYDSTIYYLSTGNIKDYASAAGDQTLVFTANTFTNTNAQGATTFSYTFEEPNTIRYRNPLSSSSVEYTHTIEAVNESNLIISEIENTGTEQFKVTNYYHAN